MAAEVELALQDEMRARQGRVVAALGVERQCIAEPGSKWLRPGTSRDDERGCGDPFATVENDGGTALAVLRLDPGNFAFTYRDALPCQPLREGVNS